VKSIIHNMFEPAVELAIGEAGRGLFVDHIAWTLTTLRQSADAPLTHDRAYHFLVGHMVGRVSPFGLTRGQP